MVFIHLQFNFTRVDGNRKRYTWIKRCFWLQFDSTRTVLNITKTHPCNIQQYFTAVKMLIFR